MRERRDEREEGLWYCLLSNMPTPVTRKYAGFPKMAEQGPMAIAMRLRNQLQNVYKLDPLRNEVGERGV